MDIIERMLSEIGISYPSRQIYLSLLEHGTSSARMLAERLSMTRPSVYDHLKELAQAGLTAEEEIDGKAHFAIHDIEDLERRVSEKESSLRYLGTLFQAEKKKLSVRTPVLEPKVKFFEGKEGIARVYRDMLWEEDTTILTLWPYEEMLRVLGREELDRFNKKRIKNHIRLRTIWPRNAKPGKAYVWKGGDWGVDRKKAPKGMTFGMNYSVYGEKVSFMSSTKESYGFIVHSREFSELMRTQFEALWQISDKK